MDDPSTLPEGVTEDDIKFSMQVVIEMYEEEIAQGLKDKATCDIDTSAYKEKKEVDNNKFL